MQIISKSLLAALAATIVLSILMIAKAKMGIAPGFNVIALLAAMAGQPGVPVVGWIVHLAIGIVGYGVVFGLLAGKLPGSFTVQGLLLAVAGWLVMMIILMPMAGKGLFGLGIAPMVPVMTLVLHLIFGVVLGGVYGTLAKSGGSAARA